MRGIKCGCATSAMVIAAVASTGCAADNMDGELIGVDDAALSKKTEAPPDAPPPKRGDVSFARDGSERVYGVKIDDKPKNATRVVYSVRVADLDASEELRVRGEVTLSRCNRKDTAGLSGDSKTTPCDSKEMRASPYGYTPRFSAAFVLASSPTDASGERIGGWSETTCPENEHHCALALPEAALRDPKNAQVKYVNLVVAADSRGSNARSWDVMEVEQHHGSLAVTRLAAGAEAHAGGAASNDVLEKGDLGIDQTEDEGDMSQARQVVYQVRLDGLREGDVIDADLKMVARLRGGFSCDPLITGELIVTADKGSKDTKKARDASFGAKNGRNCDEHGGGSCVYQKSGAVRLGKGTPSTMFVSYIATAARSCAAPNGHDKWYVDRDGGRLSVNVRR